MDHNIILSFDDQVLGNISPFWNCVHFVMWDVWSAALSFVQHHSWRFVGNIVPLPLNLLTYRMVFSAFHILPKVLIEFYPFLVLKSWYSLVDIISRLWNGQPRNWVWFLAEFREFSRTHNIQNAFAAHSASVQMAMGYLSLGIRQLELEAD
jgi:hypothetical protein